MSVPTPRISYLKRPAAGLFCTSLLLLGAVACESLPGEKRTQGAVIGGVGGAAAGAILADEDHRLLGAVIGGALGAGGGYLIGRRMEGESDSAPVDTQKRKITSEQVHAAQTADIDKDGNVTLAEIVAMEGAGLSDEDMIKRLEATTMVFALTDPQEKVLRDNGVSQVVITRLETLNRAPDQISAPARR